MRAGRRRRRRMRGGEDVGDGLGWGDICALVLGIERFSEAFFGFVGFARIYAKGISFFLSSTA